MIEDGSVRKRRNPDGGKEGFLLCTPAQLRTAAQLERTGWYSIAELRN